MVPRMHLVVPAVHLTLLLTVASASAPAAAETDLPKLKVTADFEGGSCTVVSIDQERRPDFQLLRLFPPLRRVSFSQR
jgi:hypothetical protein